MKTPYLMNCGCECCKQWKKAFRVSMKERDAVIEKLSKMIFDVCEHFSFMEEEMVQHKTFGPLMQYWRENA